MTAAQRERWTLLAALAALVLLCWFYLFDMSRAMSAMSAMSGDMANMPGMDGAPAKAMGGTMAGEPWSLADWLAMLAMWVIMMTAMMVPTAIRSVLIFARIGVQAQRMGRSHVSPYWFSAGYVAIWSAFGIVATALQWALTQAAMLSPMMRAADWRFGALLLVMAGLWQLSPWKGACLKHCQSPAIFIARHRRAGKGGAFRMGLAHGAYCVGCCWAVMILLFVGGVMNLAWIAIITAFVLAEKLLPPRFGFSRISGWLMILAGIGIFLVAGMPHAFSGG